MAALKGHEMVAEKVDEMAAMKGARKVGLLEHAEAEN